MTRAFSHWSSTRKVAALRGETARALICPRGEGGDPKCPLDGSLTEVVSVEQARDAIAVWSAWRRGLSTYA